MAKREKSSRTYQDSSDNDIEILGITQGSDTPRILHSAASSRPAKRAAAASYVRSHRYNYSDTSDAEGGDEDFVASPLADNDDDYLSDVEVVEKFSSTPVVVEGGNMISGG